MNISVFLFDLGYEKTFDYPRKKKKEKTVISRSSTKFQ